MGIKENIHELKSYVSGAPAANRTKINHIIKLYEDRRIPTFNYALSKTLLLASGNENTIKSGRADKEYDKVVAKFGKAPAEVARQQAPRQGSSQTAKAPVAKAPPKAPPVDLKKVLKEGGKASRAAKKATDKYNAERDAETYTPLLKTRARRRRRKKRI